MVGAYLPAVLTGAREIHSLGDDQLTQCHGVERMMSPTALRVAVVTDRATIAHRRDALEALQRHLIAREILNHCDHHCDCLRTYLFACSPVSETNSERRQFTQCLYERKQFFSYTKE
jgi:hypothetical protein